MKSLRQKIYDKKFYEYIAAGSTRSAQVVAPLLTRTLRPASLLDVGCGAGAWLAQYRLQPIADCLGIDGAYVTPESLLVPGETFRPQDISQEFDLGRRFDLVQCVEVGEHLPGHTSETLVRNLVRHGDRLVFSAAVPGQGGLYHINERPLEFWRQAFAAHGYEAFDFIRPAVLNHPRVEFWYRYNMLLYVHQRAIDTLPEEVKRTHVPAGRPLANVAPFVFRLRTSVLRLLPTPTVSRLAAVKHRVHIALRPLSRGAE